MLNSGLNPEDLPSHFLEVKTKIDQYIQSESKNKASVTIGEELKWADLHEIRNKKLFGNQELP